MSQPRHSAKTCLVLEPRMRSRPQPVSSEMAREIEAILPDLRHMALRLSPCNASADDLVQKTLLRIWSAPETWPHSNRDGLRDVALATVRALAAQRAREQGEEGRQQGAA